MPKIDTDTLFSTAEVLRTLNPGRATVAQMRRFAERVKDGENTYISTCGWVAYTWVDHDGATHISFAVTPYAVSNYLATEKANG